MMILLNRPIVELCIFLGNFFITMYTFHLSMKYYQFDILDTRVGT